MKANLNVLAYSVMCGVLMGLIYEILRILRVTLFPSSVRISRFKMKRLPSTSEATAVALRGDDTGVFSAAYIFNAVCDVLFGVISGACAAVLIFHTNNGEIRWFALAGCALGFAVYLRTLGRLILRIYVKTKNVVFKFVKRVLSVLLLPIIIPIKAISKRLKKRMKKKKAKRTLLKILKEKNKKDERDTSESDNCEGEGAVSAG